MFELNYKTKLQMGGEINQSHNVGGKDEKKKQKKQLNKTKNLAQFEKSI